MQRNFSFFLSFWGFVLFIVADAPAYPHQMFASIAACPQETENPKD
jgi:hypothetical protein